MKTKHILDPIYNADVVVLFDYDDNKISDYLKKYYDYTDFDKLKHRAASCFELENAKTKSIKYFVTFTEYDLSTISHECYHLVCRIFDNRDIDYGYNSEPFAYYLEYFVSIISRWYWDRIVKKKK